MTRCVIAGLLALLALTGHAQNAPAPLVVPLPGRQAEPQMRPGVGQWPQAGEPAAPAPTRVLRIYWDDLSTLIYIDGDALDEQGRTSEAWICTFRTGNGLEVRYQGRAYVDTDGALQIDARGAAVAGPGAFFPNGRQRWSPDSFRLHGLAVDDAVDVVDDYLRGNPGRLNESLAPGDPGFATLRLNALVRFSDTL